MEKPDIKKILSNLETAIAKAKPIIEKPEDPNEPFEKLDDKGKMNRLYAMCNDHKAALNYAFSAMQNVYGELDTLYSKNWQLSDKMYEEMGKHNINHLPKLTAGQMQKVLDTCGLAGDFAIEKPRVFCSASVKGNKTYTVNLDIKDK